MGENHRYILLGAAGYIAPRHMRAIAETGGDLVAICDISDSVGAIDKYFPGARYYRNAINCLQLMQGNADTAVICTPNHKHAGHILQALGCGYDVICEKPLVTAPDDLDEIRKAERESGKRVYGVMQMRHHPNAPALDAIARPDSNEIEVVYHTPRGLWYWQSWKGQAWHSGGLPMNIGIHIFDLLMWKFGSVVDVGAHCGGGTQHSIEGTFALERATVKYSLSIANGIVPRRSVIMNGMEIDLSTGFENLHSEVYREIVAGRGWGIDDLEPALRLAEQIHLQDQGRQAELMEDRGI